MGQFFILHSRVQQEYNGLLVNALNHIFKSNLSLNNFKWLLTKVELSCVRNIIPLSRKRLWNGYPVLNQDLQNHDPPPPPPPPRLLFNHTNLLSSSSTQSYPQAAAVSKFLSSHSSVAGSVISDSAARCTPYLSPKRQMKNGAQRPIVSRHMRRTCSLFCWDWLLFHRRSTGRKDVPRSRQSLFSLGNTCSCRKSLSTWKSWNVEHTNGRITCLPAAWPRAADKLDPSLSIGISCKKMTRWLLS